MNLASLIWPWGTIRHQGAAILRQAEMIEGQRKTADGLKKDLREQRMANDELSRRLADMAVENRTLHRNMSAAVTDAQVSGSALSTAQPEFVLVGIPRPNGSKRLQASRKLDVTAFAMTEPDNPPPRWKLGVIMGDLLVIDKPTYAEALEHLATIWRNHDREAQAKAFSIERHPSTGRYQTAAGAALEQHRAALPAGGFEQHGPDEHSPVQHAFRKPEVRALERHGYNCAEQGCPGPEKECSCILNCGKPGCSGYDR